MEFIIRDAVAQTGDTAPSNPILSFVPLIVLFALFYFFLIRPQQKRAKHQKEMVAGLKKGDHVVTNGGLMGRITAVDDNYVGLEVAANVQVKVQRHAIQTLVPKQSGK
ncbi:MAG TPA: preprotein translocase subunit YajC [Gammaproteobacteria bacterium]|nr:preprotein translocase subunit YajC [Gammaproteobacteria bacterium]